MITDDVFQALPGAADVDRVLPQDISEVRAREGVGRVEECVFQHQFRLIEVLAKSGKLALFEIPDRPQPDDLQVTGTRVSQRCIVRFVQVFPLGNAAVGHPSQRAALSTALPGNDLEQAAQLGTSRQFGQFLISAETRESHMKQLFQDNIGVGLGRLPFARQIGSATASIKVSGPFIADSPGRGVVVQFQGRGGDSHNHYSVSSSV